MSPASPRPPARSALWRRAIRPAIYVIGLVPAVWTFHLAVTDQLGADPLKVLEHTLGLWSLRFLMAGLAITPLWRMGGPNLIDYRRAIGLLAFFYAVFHVTVYVWLDQGLDFEAIWGDILKRPYITIGLISFLILVPLAVTSNDAMVRRMGPRVWQSLHRWVYLAAAAGAVHFVMLVKAWPPEPLIYAGLVATLLLWRVWEQFVAAPARRRARRRPTSPATATAATET